jgi:hypothetical protein
MSVRRLILAAVILPAAATGLLAGSAAAQGRPTAEERLRGRLDAATEASVLALVDSARAVGLPTEPLVDKALEGASKRAPGPRIVTAVRTLSTELGGARDALGGDAPPAEIAAAAGALHIGVRPGEIARLRSARSRQPLTVALGVLSDLVARGVPTDTATMAVTVLVDARVADDELVDFRRSVERDIALGAPPSAAAAGRLTSERFNVGGDAALEAGGSSVPRPRPPRRP